MPTLWNEAPRLTTGFIDTQNDPAPGVPLSSPSGSIVQPYSGQLGARLPLTRARAAALSSVPATRTFYEGVYMYVRTKATSTIAPAVGLPCYWDDRAAYQVIPDIPNTGADVAGWLAGFYVNSLTKGNYGWIQVSGLAWGKFTTVSKSVPAEGDVAVLDTGTSLLNVLVDAVATFTAVQGVSPGYKLIVGTAYTAPASGLVSLVNLTNMSWYAGNV